MWPGPMLSGDNINTRKDLEMLGIILHEEFAKIL